MSSHLHPEPNGTSQDGADATTPESQEHSPILSGPYHDVARSHITQLLPTLKRNLFHSILFFGFSFYSFISRYYAENSGEWRSITSYDAIARALLIASLLMCFYCALIHAVGIFWVDQYVRRVPNPDYASFCRFRYLGLTGHSVLGVMSLHVYILALSGLLFLVGFTALRFDTVFSHIQGWFINNAESIYNTMVLLHRYFFLLVVQIIILLASLSFSVLIMRSANHLPNASNGHTAATLNASNTRIEATCSKLIRLVKLVEAKRIEAACSKLIRLVQQVEAARQSEAINDSEVFEAIIELAGVLIELNEASDELSQAANELSEAANELMEVDNDLATTMAALIAALIGKSALLGPKNAILEAQAAFSDLQILTLDRQR